MPNITCPDCGAAKTRNAKRCMTCAFPLRVLRRDGYVQVRCPGHPIARRDGYAQEHRMVIYEAGIEVPEGFQVHHINGDRADNRLENLEVIEAVAHKRLHLLADGFVRNQFGTFRVGRTPEEQHEIRRAMWSRGNRRAAEKKRAAAL